MDEAVVGWCDSGGTHGAFALSMLGLQQYELEEPDSDYRLLGVLRTSGAYVQVNKNLLVSRFLASEADWLLQIDCDESFSPSLLRDLMRCADADEHLVVSGLIANVHAYPDDVAEGGVIVANNVYRETEEGLYEPSRVDGFAPSAVDAVGGGALLVHRRVFEALDEPWWWLEWFKADEKDGHFMGEDLAFCRRVREAGFTILLNPLAEIVHWKTLPMTPISENSFHVSAAAAKQSMMDA